MTNDDESLKRIFEQDQDSAGLNENARLFAQAAVTYYNELLTGGLSTEQAYGLTATAAEMLWGKSLWPGGE